jgi:hypothetical protein
MNKRIPRKAGQPAKSDKHSDLYTDEDPKGKKVRDKKLTSRDWERMAAYGYGFFYGKSGYELDAPWHHEDPDYKYVMQGFMDGHELFCIYGVEDSYVDYNFDILEDEGGKYVHIDIG